MGCLYKIDFPNGKAYVGVSKYTADVRLRGHLAYAFNKNSAHAVHRALRKFWFGGGVKVNTLVVASDTRYLLLLERRAIAAYGTLGALGYNMTSGGDGVRALSVDAAQRKAARIKASWVGANARKRDTARRLTRARAGIPTTDKQRAATAAANAARAGWHHSDAAKAVMSQKAMGRGTSDIQKKAVAAANKRRKQS